LADGSVKKVVAVIAVEEAEVESPLNGCVSADIGGMDFAVEGLDEVNTGGLGVIGALLIGVERWRDGFGAKAEAVGGVLGELDGLDCGEEEWDVVNREEEAAAPTGALNLIDTTPD